jgi:putative hemolysin
MLTKIIILIILMMANAFFAASEMALISLNDNRMKVMADEGNRKAAVVVSLLKEPSKFLATIQIGITLAGFLASAFAAESFAGELAAWLYEAGVPVSQSLLQSISVIVITFLLSYFTLVFGELVPKRFAMQRAEAIAMLAARPLRGLSVLTSPFVKLLTLSTNLFVRLLGGDPHANDEEVTEEEIRMMVDVGKERGTIQEAEKFMIDNVFDFDNKKVSDIMTHRTYVTAIPRKAGLDDVVDITNKEKYSRYPVYEDTLDNIIGILHVKDLIPYIENCDRDRFSVDAVIRKPYFVPESKRTDLLMKDMQKKKVHMAVVIDEYGGTAGIVTMEDLIEEIVGNIFDEYDEEEKEITVIDDNTFLMSGMITLDDARDFLGVDLPIDDYDTLSGFIIGQLGRFPEANDKPEIEWEGLVFKVEEADRKRIWKVKVTKT